MAPSLFAPLDLGFTTSETVCADGIDAHGSEEYPDGAERLAAFYAERTTRRKALTSPAVLRLKPSPGVVMTGGAMLNDASHQRLTAW